MTTMRRELCGASGIPTVLVPGLLSTSEIFALQVPALWRHGPVTIASTAGQATIADMAAAILRTAPESFALGGISMGGYVCFEIMRQAPQRVVRLALFDTSARGDTPKQAARRRAVLSEARRENFADFAEKIFTRALHPENRGDPRLRRINAAMAQMVNFDDFARNTDAVIHRADSRPMLGAIAIPTIVAVGDRDDITPVAHAEEIADAIPGASLHVIPQAGHAATIEQPDTVNRLLEAWAAITT